MGVVNLGQKALNGQMLTPEMTLKEALGDVGKQGALANGKKCIVLALDESDNQYQISFYQAGMKMSECVALCDIAKGLFKEHMGYV